ncbi:polymorphic toxin-type HINT domain-containing protein [Actinokineospora auranticolor]|uniref:Intein n=1 Tax=Actinokineospora auranticolor TaxID=155976 RepID=A0A2S6GEY5_9PSEU|nr:polymorphic toxin-type HINT domain-containing protein [Actinokineospora auranticolor]PPK63666.1 intein [Actinokineospora auranticolor]
MFFIGLFVPMMQLVAVVYWTVQVYVYRIWIEPPWDGGGGVNKADAVKESGMSVQEYEDAKKLAADKRGWVDVAIQIAGDTLQEMIGIKGIVDSCVKDFNILECGYEIVSALPWTKIFKAGKIVDKIIDAIRNAKDWLRRRDKAMGDLRRVEEAERRLASLSGCNSFTPGTLVLLADGSARPIEQLKLGDQVLATNPETGETTPQAVVGTIAGQGDKRLVDITMSNGATISATDGHPFWLADSARWSIAAELRAGSQVLETDGRTATVIKVDHRYAAQRAHNLTVDTFHTYYVVAGGISALVHNCPTGGTGTGPADDAIRAIGPWTKRDIQGAAHGFAPKRLGNNIELHHADQMPGSAIHELDRQVHRGKGTNLHRNKSNQGVTAEMRVEDRQLHWWYRSQEQGWGSLPTQTWYDNLPK